MGSPILAPWTCLCLSLATVPAHAARTVDLGEPKVDTFYTLGLNVITGSKDVGGIGLFRFKRVTHFTFLDTQLEGYVVPRALEEEQPSWFGRARVKRSTKSFDWPFLYDWTTYELKTSTEEALNARASLSSGFGAFLSESHTNRINLEVGFVVDYASLQAYAEQLSNGYGKGALEWDIDLAPFSAKVLNHLYWQLTQTNFKDGGNQTRWELDVNTLWDIGESFRISVGGILVRYLRLEKAGGDQPAQAVTLYVGATYRY